jgi:hypothetical protein
VLPPLLQELRDVSLQPVLLPIVLRIVRQQDPAEFADASLPALRPLLASAAGETLLLLVQHAELLQGCMPPAVAAQVIPALLVRAAEHGERARVLRRLPAFTRFTNSRETRRLAAVVRCRPCRPLTLTHARSRSPCRRSPAFFRSPHAPSPYCPQATRGPRRRC